jgi:hypothetical protein
VTPALGAVFVRWTWCRAVLHRGWWLVAGVYLVLDARLGPSELVLSWTFASGADVAWISDELDDPARVPVVLIRAEQAQLTGTVAGLAGIGGLAWLTGRTTAMVLAGAAMSLLGLYVAGLPERRLVAGPAKRWPAAWSILTRGSALVRASPELLAVFAATFLISGVADAFGRLYPLRLLTLAPAVDPVVWFAGLGVLMCLAGAAALRFVQPRMGGPHTVRRGYVVACAVAAVGVAGLAFAPEPISGSLAVLLAAGALPLTRSFGTIWVNARAAGTVRATVHSLLAEAEHAGKIVCGLAVAFIGGRTGVLVALTACSALLVVAGIVVRRHRGRGIP